MNEKINLFLQDTGYEADTSDSSSMQLLRYFEQEFGLDIMGFLEKEWIEEQIEHDLKSGYFKALRNHISEEYHGDYDRTVAQLTG